MKTELLYNTIYKFKVIIFIICLILLKIKFNNDILFLKEKMSLLNFIYNKFNKQFQKM